MTFTLLQKIWMATCTIDAEREYAETRLLKSYSALTMNGKWTGMRKFSQNAGATLPPDQEMKWITVNSPRMITVPEDLPVYEKQTGL